MEVAEEWDILLLPEDWWENTHQAAEKSQATWKPLTKFNFFKS